MFNREELIARLSSLAGKDKPFKDKPPIEVIAFAPDDFPSSSSEESITICRGAKSDYEDALHFWVVAQQCENWTGREEYLIPYLQEALCRPVEEQAFMLLLSGTQSLKHPLVVIPKGRFIRAQQMANEWYNSSALAEFGQGYISFHWETTA